jgi:glycosyltransferase involved in cell wall biosynthesis
MSGRPWLIAQLDAMHRSRGGDWYYRTFAPGRALAALPNVHVVNVDLAHRRLPLILEQADVLVVNGVCSVDLLPVIQQRKQSRRVTVFEINDDVQQIQTSNPLSGFFAQPENLRLFRRLALSSDAVQYSVPELERLYGWLNARGRVFLNQVVTLPPLRKTDAGEGVSIGWGGSAGHFEDMAEVAPALIAFVLGQPSVTLHLMCSDKIWGLFDALPGERKRRTAVGSIDEYYAFVSQLDIGIAPNRDAGFNRARSDVKFLEYAGWGAVPVVQHLAPYLTSVRHGENGFLFASIDKLTSLLARLVTDAEERQRIRNEAHAYVQRERLQAAHVAERLAFYAELMPTPVAGADPGRVFAELTALAGAEVAERHVTLAHTRYESLLHDGLLLLQSAGERERGAVMLREAARLEPAQAMPDLFLGVQLDLEPELRSALAKNPRSVQAELALGSHCLERAQYKPALERFMAAAQLAPGYEMPFAHAARSLQKLGALKEAAEFERLARGMAGAVSPPV